MIFLPTRSNPGRSLNLTAFLDDSGDGCISTAEVKDSDSAARDGDTTRRGAVPQGTSMVEAGGGVDGAFTGEGVGIEEDSPCPRPRPRPLPAGEGATDGGVGQRESGCCLEPLRRDILE